MRGEPSRAELSWEKRNVVVGGAAGGAAFVAPCQPCGKTKGTTFEQITIYYINKLFGAANATDALLQLQPCSAFLFSPKVK